MSKEKSKVTKIEEAKPRPSFNPDVQPEPNGKFYSDSELQEIFNSLIHVPWQFANNPIHLLQVSGKPIHNIEPEPEKEK